MGCLLPLKIRLFPPLLRSQLLEVDRAIQKPWFCPSLEADRAIQKPWFCPSPAINSLKITTYSGHNLWCFSSAVRTKMITSLERQLHHHPEIRSISSEKLKTIWSCLGYSILWPKKLVKISCSVKETYSNNENTSEIFEVKGLLNNLRQGEMCWDW